MTSTSFAFSALVAALLSAPALSLAQTAENAEQDKAPPPVAQAGNEETTPNTTRQRDIKVVYVPPRRGAPSVRVVAATRGRSTRVFLATLAPNHLGWTLRAQPTLYWYVSEVVDDMIEVTIVDDKKIDPVLEVRLPGPVEAGIQTVDLKEHGILLSEGKEYLWSVSIIHDTEQRSKDTFAEGAITLVEPSISLKESLRAAGREERPMLLAKAGFWYDAFGEVSRLAAEDRPDADRWRRERVDLLQQVGVGALAAEVGIRFDQ